MNKVFHTERIGYEDRTLMAAVLHENCAQVSTLRLTYRGYAAGGLEYRDQVTLLHRGAVLYHGQVTDISPSGEGTNARTVVTVSNLLWQMGRLTLGEQLADLRAAEAERKGMDWQVSAEAAMSSWQQLQGSCTSTAEGWSTRGTGIRVEVAEGLPSVGRTLKRIGAVSQWTAMRALQQANPGTVFRVDYEEGVVRIADVFESDPLIWNTDEAPIASAALSPQYGSVLSGVAVAVNFTGGVTVVKYPASIDPGEDGVRLFTASAQNQWEAGQQGAYIARQLEFYFDRASRLQNRGSIRLSLADLAGSPISRRVLLVGNGTHEQWGEVDNIVAEVEWDLLRGTADLSVGLTIEAPDFDTLVFDSGGGDSGDSGGGGGWEATTKEKSTDETTTGHTPTAGGDETTGTAHQTTGEPDFAVSMDGAVTDKTTDGFVWSLTWAINNEADKRLITSTRLWIDNEEVGGIAPGDTAFAKRVEYGLHVAQVEVTRADGAKASATATAFAEPNTDEWQTTTGGTTTGETPTDTGNPIELEVSVGTDKRPNNYLLNITAVYSGGSGAPLQCIISTSPGNSVNRDSYSQECGYGIEYNWQVQVLDSATGKATVKDGTVMIPASEAPQTTTTGGTTAGETPTGGGDTPTGGGGDTPTGGGGDTPTGGGGETPTGGDTPNPPTGGGGDTPTGGGGDTPTGGGGETPTGGDTPNPPTGGGGDTPAECPCEPKLNELEGKVASLESTIQSLQNSISALEGRLSEIENKDGGTGGCNCSCGDILGAVQAALASAVEEAVAGAVATAVFSYQTEWSSDELVLDNTEHESGVVIAEGKATVSGGDATGTVTIRYQ